MTVTPAHIRHSNLIEGIDSWVADAAGEAAWAWLAGQDEITPASVLKLHRIVTGPQRDLEDDYKGYWRPIQVYVGNHVPPEASQVPGLVDTWCCALALSVKQADSEEAFTPTEHHVAFERIHPFVDGNGRTGRLLMWWHEMQLGEEPTLIKVSERQDYYRWFQL